MSSKQSAPKEGIPQEEVVERRFGGQSGISDKFKLLVAPLTRNISHDPNNPRMETVEHCHFFHTIDSNGKRMESCVAICGHTHKMEKIGDLKYRCLPANGHTHEVEYIDSYKYELRKYRPELANINN